MRNSTNERYTASEWVNLLEQKFQRLQDKREYLLKESSKFPAKVTGSKISGQELYLQEMLYKNQVAMTLVYQELEIWKKIANSSNSFGTYGHVMKKELLTLNGSEDPPEGVTYVGSAGPQGPQILAHSSEKSIEIPESEYNTLVTKKTAAIAIIVSSLFAGFAGYKVCQSLNKAK